MADAPNTDFEPLTAEQKKQRDVEFASKLRRRSFTWYNYTEADVEYLRGIPAKSADYVIFGFEVSQSGKAHLQGYVEFSCGITGTATINRLNHGKREKRGGITVLKLVKDIREVQIRYCKKDESGDPAMIEKYGAKWFETVNVERNQGARTDWHEIHDLIKDGKTLVDIAENHPENAMKYHAGIDRMIRAHEEKAQFEAFCAKFDDVKLRPWQERLDNELKGVAGDRRIIWVYETVGNVGKSWFSKYLVAKRGAARFPNCRTQDLAMAYKGEPIIAFDFSRTVEGRLNYGLIEQLRDGTIFSSKYESRTKYFADPHIVCFANWLPDLTACSGDRWSIREVTNEPEVVQEPTTSDDCELLDSFLLLLEHEESTEVDSNLVPLGGDLQSPPHDVGGIAIPRNNVQAEPSRFAGSPTGGVRLQTWSPDSIRALQAQAFIDNIAEEPEAGEATSLLIDI